MRAANERPRTRRTSLALWIPGRPIPYARTRGAGAQRYQSAGYRDWRTTAAQHLALGRGPTIEGPTAVRLEINPDGIRLAFAAIDTSARQGLRGDLDNYVKAILDAATDAKVITDDRLVQSIEAAFVPRRHDES